MFTPASLSYFGAAVAPWKVSQRAQKRRSGSTAKPQPGHTCSDAECSRRRKLIVGATFSEDSDSASVTCCDNPESILCSRSNMRLMYPHALYWPNLLHGSKRTIQSGIPERQCL